ncbi:protein LTO1 homolog isoform X3 [Crotalus tigris]|uniref:protein LTO1 homolog isoform X3 n=1 Tax=Crotalus tigris TaxID=88082 RepID=UPI00192F6B55|nr:protein LTO1 homolog isoform X3 [Crotalus tigris]
MAAVEGEPDAFDAIVMAETRFHGEGYQDGYAEGVHAGVVEGRQHGIQQGASIGSEIGSYLGFALTWQQLLQKTSAEKCSKKIKVLELLIEMIQNFPLEDPAYDKLQDDLEKIRGRFKQVCVQFHFWNTNCTQHVFRKNNIIVMKHNRNRRG